MTPAAKGTKRDPIKRARNRGGLMTPTTPPAMPTPGQLDIDGNDAAAIEKARAAAIEKARRDVASGRKRPSEAAMEAMADFAQAERDAAAQTKRDLAGQVRELRRRAAGAKERAATAQAKFETAVALLASEKPAREDWYEHPGPLARRELLDAAGLGTVALHRIMERHRKNAAPAKGRRGRR